MTALKKILIVDKNIEFSARLAEKVNELGFNGGAQLETDLSIGRLAKLKPDLIILGPFMKMVAFMKCLLRIKIFDPLIPVPTLEPVSDPSAKSSRSAS